MIPDEIAASQYNSDGWAESRRLLEPNRPHSLSDARPTAKNKVRGLILSRSPLGQIAAKG
jgi:hypothetical protein